MRFLNHKTVVAVAVIALAVISTSCFKEEPLNAECDIEQAWVHVNDLEASFYNANHRTIYAIDTLTLLKARSTLCIASSAFRPTQMTWPIRSLLEWGLLIESPVLA